MNNIILFATYWNSIDWIKESLEQIDLIDPAEIIICEGCFDLGHHAHSDDGTLEVIESYIKRKEKARLVSPVRLNKFEGLIKIWGGNEKQSMIRRLMPARIKAVIRASLSHHYRINQALTFNKMISMSKHWKEGGWFMNYDCDQFYSDEVIDGFNLTNKHTDLGQLTASELTFFHDENKCTSEYEKRNFNNMPHKIFSNTAIVTTRDIVRENIFGFKYYRETEKSKYLGQYNHYKFSNTERFAQGYTVGDRVMPDILQYEFFDYSGPIPSVLKHKFSK